MNARDEALANATRKLGEAIGLTPEAGQIALVREAVNAIASVVLCTIDPKLEAILHELKADKQAEAAAEPELIQGYTAEQWQEIKEGKYLCEFTSHEKGEFHCDEYSHLEGIEDGPFSTIYFKDGTLDKWLYCRPAQIKGVMRPMFVEPVDKKSPCYFFTRSEKNVSYWVDSISWEDHFDHERITRTATSYIEL